MHHVLKNGTMPLSNEPDWCTQVRYASLRQRRHASGAQRRSLRLVMPLEKKKKGNYQKILVVVVGVHEKLPSDGAEFSKNSSKTSSKLKAPELERFAPNLTKARETKNSSK